MPPRLIGLAATGLLALVFGVASLFVWADDDDTPSVTGTPTASATTDAVAVGRNLFLAKGCAGCHQISGVSGSNEIGPNLTSLPRQAGERVAGMSAEQYVRASILAPSAFVVPGYGGSQSPMPQLPVSDDELDALVAFLLIEK
jgi:cytochrome c oxidase subunit 2